MKPLIHLIRPVNLVVILLTQWLCFYFGGMGESIDFIRYILLVTLLTTAAGYIINNYYDQQKDKLNGKPGIALFSRRYWIYIYLALNLVALLLAWIDSNTLLFFTFSIQVLLFAYAFRLSNWPLVGNFLVALLSVAVVYVFYMSKRVGLVSGDMWVLLICIFLVSMAREIVKDIQDRKGDKQLGAQTLPIVLGKNAAHIVADILILCNSMFLFSWGYYAYFAVQRIPFALCLILAIFGLVWLIAAHFIKGENRYAYLSGALKWQMVLGLCLIPFLQHGG